MTRSNDLQAAYDAADQRVHEAREALRGAIRARRQAEAAIAEARVPVDLQAHLERVRQAGELTSAEQAERETAQAAYDEALAAEAPITAALGKLLSRIDPLDGSTRQQRRGQSEAEADAVDRRIEQAAGVAQRELERVQSVTARARRELNAVIRRTNAARQERRSALKRQWAADQAEQRRNAANLALSRKPSKSAFWQHLFGGDAA